MFNTLVSNRYLALMLGFLESLKLNFSVHFQGLTSLCVKMIGDEEEVS